MTPVSWRCPQCDAGLNDVSGVVSCDRCQVRWTLVDGVWTAHDAPAVARFDADAAGRLEAMRARDHFWLRQRRQLFTMLIDRVIPDGASVSRAVELGCGGGDALAILGRRAATVVGVDGHRRLLRAAARNPVAALIEADVCATPLGAGQFDLVAAFDVIEHVDPADLLSEARRLSRPGARLLLSAPASPMLWSDLDERAGHRCRYRWRQLRDELRANGWRPLGHTHAQCLLFPLVLFTRRAGGRAALDRERRPPRVVDRALGLVNAIEVAILGRTTLPFGSSVVAWAERA